jgi:hypothetical protein
MILPLYQQHHYFNFLTMRFSSTATATILYVPITAAVTRIKSEMSIFTLSWWHCLINVISYIITETVLWYWGLQCNAKSNSRTQVLYHASSYTNSSHKNNDKIIDRNVQTEIQGSTILYCLWRSFVQWLTLCRKARSNY